MSEIHLRNLMAGIYSRKASGRTYRQHSSRVQKYFEDVIRDRFYVCCPEPSAIASFAWMSKHDFSIVIETFPGGDLIRCSEKVVGALLGSLERKNLKARFNVSIESLDDGKTYISGEPNPIAKRLMDELKDNFALIAVGGIVAIIAKFIIKDYFPESIAALITLSLISLWETVVVWRSYRKKLIYWRMNNHV